MLITSLNTLFVNGNPLMRYDGYYALADWIRVPNLGTVSRYHLGQQMNRFFLNQQSVVQRRRLGGSLITYAVASFFYRWFILAAIATGIWTFFEYHQLRSIGNSVVALVIILMLIPMLLGGMGWWKKSRQFGIRWLNTLAVVGVLAGALYLFFAVEFSHRVWANCQIQFNDPTYIFAPDNGRFSSELHDGQTIKQGTPIGAIENRDLELEQVTLDGQLRESRLNLALIGFKSDSHLLAGKTEFSEAA